MKRLFCALLAAILLFPVFGVASADIDLSGMSFEELVALKERIMMAIWESEDWQEVRVPQGVYKVGESIPAGKWTITCSEDYYCSFDIGTELNESGTRIPFKATLASKMVYNPLHSLFEDGDCTEYTVTLSDGMYFVVDCSSCIFTPYAGTPDLGFKK